MRYNPNYARFNTPGRNARQQELAERKRERQVRQGERVGLEDCEEVIAEGSGEGENGVEAEGEYMEHPQLARKVNDVRIFLSYYFPSFFTYPLAILSISLSPSQKTNCC